MGLMKTKKRQKLCHSCEGEVDLDVIFCPFCGADLLEEKASLEEDPFLPPYSPKNPLQEAITQQQEEVGGEKSEGVLLPITLLSTGSWLFLLGVFLFLFSKNGIATLKIDARFWLIYILIAVPFLIAGYKFLKKIR